MNKDIIKSLKFPENVRVRPQYLIGSLENCDNLLRELVDNAIDEVLGKYATKIWIEDSNGLYKVMDNGRGIPYYFDIAEKKTAVRVAAEELHAGSKFKKKKLAVGMHGVGLSAVNALSDYMKIYTRVDEQTPTHLGDWFEGQYYCVTYNRGIFKGETLEKRLNTEHSTIIEFKPDLTIMKSPKAELPYRNLQVLKFVSDKIFKSDLTVYYNNSVLNLYKDLYKFMFINQFSNPDFDYNTEVYFIINCQVSEDLDTEEYYGSANTVTSDFGVHIKLTTRAFKEALKEKYNIEHDYLTNGLQLYVNILAPEMAFDNQIKSNLVSIDEWRSQDFVTKLKESFLDLFETNKKVFDLHVERLNELSKSYSQIADLELIEEIVGLDLSEHDRLYNLPRKLYDSIEHGEGTSLYIVEGDSAGGSIVQGRDPYIHAVLPLRGKLMNTIVSSDDEDIFSNEEVISILQSVGCGIDGYNRPEFLRYEKIVIAADADPDGAHIALLVMGFFILKMKFLFDLGAVYLAETPLYLQNGTYIYDETKLNRSKPFTRFKGLGELNPEQAYDVLLSDKAKLHKLTLKERDIEVVKTLMSDPESRKDIFWYEGLLVNDPVTFINYLKTKFKHG